MSYGVLYISCMEYVLDLLIDLQLCPDSVGEGFSPRDSSHLTQREVCEPPRALLGGVHFCSPSLF